MVAEEKKEEERRSSPMVPSVLPFLFFLRRKDACDFRKKFFKSINPHARVKKTCAKEENERTNEARRSSVIVVLVVVVL